jgi:hypothetical protein
MRELAAPARKTAARGFACCVVFVNAAGGWIERNVRPDVSTCTPDVLIL